MKKFLVALAIVAFAASAMAHDWGLYGSMRFATFYVNLDKDRNGGKSDSDLRDFGLQGNSRIGANVKVNDKITAKFELGVSSAGVSTRLMYGQYDFGAFKLRIGQDYTPADVLIFDQVSKGDSDLLGIGAFYEGRVEQVKLIFPVGLELALVKNKQADFAMYDVTTPKLEASYAVKAGMVDGKVFGGYQTYSAETDNATTFDTSSYVVGAAAKVKAGMVGVCATGFYGSNLATFGHKNLVSPSQNEDTTDYGFALAVFANPADNMKLEAGYGYQASDRDDKKKDETQSYYVNLKYTVAKGFFIQPEVAVYDYMEDAAGNKQGKETYFGAKWQMNF